MERFLKDVAKTDDENACWLWTGRIEKTGRAPGYGRFLVRHRSKWRNEWAHRVSYSLFNGPIPSRHVIDHLCRNPRCVNPKHLDAVTQRENALRGLGNSAINAKKTHCPKGHPYDRVSKDGSRRCKICEREQCRDRKRKERAAAKAKGVILPTDIKKHDAHRDNSRLLTGRDPRRAH
jgi:hypothetical protein